MNLSSEVSVKACNLSTGNKRETCQVAKTSDCIEIYEKTYLILSHAQDQIILIHKTLELKKGAFCF